MNKIAILFATFFCLFAGGGIEAQMLAESPVSTGGDPIGSWLAEGQQLKVFVAPEILAALSSLSFGGTLTGSLDLDPFGTYTADYAVSADVKLSHILLAMDTTLVQEVKSTGTYRSWDRNSC